MLISVLVDKITAARQFMFRSRSSRTGRARIGRGSRRGQYAKRCAWLCALLFVCCPLADRAAIPVRADEVTEESIQEKEDQIEAAKAEQEQIESSISDLETLVAELEALESDLEAYVTQLDAQLTAIQLNIDSLNEQIEEKEATIAQTQIELEEAEAVQAEQYANMKERLQFIYEKGDSYMMEILLQASSFGDLLNKAYYIEELEAYDQDLLERYTQQAELIAKTKEALEAEKETLAQEKEAVEEEEATMEALLEEKSAQLAATSAEIMESAATIEEYEAQVSAQTSVIEALEAEVAADKATLEAQNQTTSVTYSGVFVWPCPSYTYISSTYGYRESPTYGASTFHSGIDLAADYGAAILAAADGTVVAASYESSMGNYIMIDHGGGVYTVYMHCSALYVSTGQSVSAGETIAAVGSTGISTGPHLHFSVRVNGSYVDPMTYLS